MHRIELAQPRDVIRMSLMAHLLVEDELPWRWKPARIRHSLRRRNHVAIVQRKQRVAQSENSISGMAIAAYGDRKAHLLLLAVDFPYRGRTLGSEMLCWLEETALCAGIEQMQLEVRARNLRAQDFYRRHGFSRVARLPDYYAEGEDALRMVHDLRRTVPEVDQRPEI